MERELDIVRWLANRESYRKLLAGFYGWWKPWEYRVEASKESIPAEFWEPRAKCGLLEADLRFLGMTEIDIERLPEAVVPELEGKEAVLGSMYVTEGSTLGGQIISRMIEEKLGFSGGEGYSFYQSYGAQVGPMWRRFGEYFEHQVTRERLPVAIKSAQETFEGLQKWLGNQG